MTREYGVLGEQHKELIEMTFGESCGRLPTLSYVKSLMAPKLTYPQLDDSYMQKAHLDISFREHYCKQSFPLLTEDFILSIKHMVDDIKPGFTCELGCGPGWLTYWLRRYGVDVVKAVDDMRWPFDKYLPFVERADSVEFVKTHPNVDLFVLSWPWMDDVAANIWKSMRDGQYLLYIGEYGDGCNANEEFFNTVEGHEVEDNWDLCGSYLRFWGLHDSPILLRRIK